MFGYIRIYEDELKVRSLKLYKAVYCGLCKTAEKRCGSVSRAFLSYDYTFFAIVRMIFTGTSPNIVKKRCGFRLFAKRDVVEENSELALSAAIFSILTYYKLLDNIHDEGFWRSLAARLLLPIGSFMRKRAVKSTYGEVDFIISDCLERISALERRGDAMLYELSSVFGDMMGSLLAMGLPEEKRSDAYRIGNEVGQFIYRADALDDVQSDEKHGSYNPLLVEYGRAEEALAAARSMRNIYLRGTDNAADILSGMKNELSSDGKRLCDIALNILYLGCNAVTDGILFGKK